MKRTHLAIQAAIVLAMVAFVSWPQFRPVRTQSVWRYTPSAAQQARTGDAARYSDTGVLRQASVRFGQSVYTPDAIEPQAGRSPRGLNGENDPAFYTPEPIAVLGGRLNALVGLARTSLNVPIPYAKVLLRNIRTGQVQAIANANQQGQFSFVDLDSSLYIVELLGPDGSVIAASEMVTLARGDLKQTDLRAAASATTVTAAMGSNAFAPTMPQVTSVASSTDVTRTTSTLASEITSK